jgi:hypothetical protein
MYQQVRLHGDLCCIHPQKHSRKDRAAQCKVAAEPDADWEAGQNLDFVRGRLLFYLFDEDRDERLNEEEQTELVRFLCNGETHIAAIKQNLGLSAAHLTLPTLVQLLQAGKLRENFLFSRDAINQLASRSLWVEKRNEGRAWQLRPGERYHLFLSHAQGNSGDQCGILHLLLEKYGFKVWYDMACDVTEEEGLDRDGMMAGVQVYVHHHHITSAVTAPSPHHHRTITAPSPHHHRTITAPSPHHHCTITSSSLHQESSVFLLFLNAGVLDREWVRLELRHARENNKPIIFVHEEDMRHGAPIGGGAAVGMYRQALEEHGLLHLMDNVESIPFRRRGDDRDAMITKIMKSCTRGIARVDACMMRF